MWNVRIQSSSAERCDVVQRAVMSDDVTALTFFSISQSPESRESSSFLLCFEAEESKGIYLDWILEFGVGLLLGCYSHFLVNCIFNFCHSPFVQK